LHKTNNIFILTLLNNGVLLYKSALSLSAGGFRAEGNIHLSKVAA
jgi:hypothetical protein